MPRCCRRRLARRTLREAPRPAPTGHLWAQLAAQYGRSVGLLALVTLIAAGLGAVARHTVAALAVVGGYLVAGEVVGGVVSRWWHTHALAAHLYAFMQGTWTYSKVP